MKLLHLFLLFVFGLTVSVQAQDIDDDMYFVSNKKKATKSTVKTQKNYTTSTFATKTDTAEDDAEANADYHTGQLRDVDDYNRRGNKASNGQVVAKLVNDTLYVYSNDSTEQKTYVYGEESESNGKYYVVSGMPISRTAVCRQSIRFETEPAIVPSNSLQ